MAYKALRDGTSATCAESAGYVGLILSYLLNYDAPDATYYSDVGYSLLDQIATAQ